MKAACRLFALLFSVLCAAQSPAPPPPPAQDLRQLLQDGLFEEEANRNLEKASAAYEALLGKYQQDRQFAATAVFRLAEIRVKQNRKEDAVALFQRVVTEFGNDALAKLSRERITALGGAVPAAAVAGTSDKEAEEIARLNDLVKNSPDLLNAKGEKALTPLQNAAKEGWLNAAAFLLDHGADPGPVHGRPALHLAAGYGRKAMVELLIARGADVNVKDASRQTALMAAVAARNVEVARVLLEHSAKPSEPSGDSNYTPLHEAVLNGHMEILRVLLDKGADINAVCPEHRPPYPGVAVGTPLVAALRAGHGDVLNLLLERKADPNIETPGGASALSLAVARKDHALAKRFIEHGAKATPPGLIFSAVVQNDIEMVRLLAAHGANLNAKDAHIESRPPLHAALAGGGNQFLRMAELLLELGASPNARNDKGETALHHALGGFMPPGAATGNTAPKPPIQAAIANPQPAAPRLRVINNPPKPPLIEPSLESEANQRQFEFCKLLVSKGADVNARATGGESVLHRALVYPNVPYEVVDWLLQRGADPAAKLQDGRTPAEVAAMNRRLWLEQRTIFRPWAKQQAVHIVFRLGSLDGDRSVYRAEPLAEFDLPPTADVLVGLAAEAIKDKTPMLPDVFELQVYRAAQDGSVERVANISRDWGSEGELPALRWGDVFVLAATGERLTTLKLANWHGPHAKPAARRLTVGLGDRERELEFYENSPIWSPVMDALPEWKFSELVARVAGAEPRAQLGAIKVERKVDGKLKEWAVDLRPDQPGKLVKSLPARLADGDRIIIPLLPPEDSQALALRRGAIFRAAPGRLFGERVFTFSEKDAAPRTLGELIAQTYLTSPMIIPDPDLARIRIHRLKGDAEETLEVNLASAVERVGPETSKDEARKLDVPLQPGDIVEIPPREGADLEHWTGLSGPIRRFFLKALSRDVMVQILPEEGKLHEIIPFFADFKRGNIGPRKVWVTPQPAFRAPFRALSAVDPGPNLLSVRLTSRDRARQFSAEEFVAINPWLLEGDHLAVERY